MPTPAVITILRAIKDGGSISRTDLQHHTRLSWGTVTNTTRDLLERRLIREEGAATTKAGRKPVRLALNRLSHTIIGVSFQPSHARIIALNLTGEILAADNVPLPPTRRPDQLLDHLATAINHLCRQESLLGRKCLGVGVAVPGRQLPCSSPPALARWGEDLAAATSLAVAVERASVCHALAECWFGSGGDAELLACLLLDPAPDLAILIGGRPLAGAHGLAGDLHALPVGPHKLPLAKVLQNADSDAGTTEAAAAVGATLDAVMHLLDPAAILVTGQFAGVPGVAEAAQAAVDGSETGVEAPDRNKAVLLPVRVSRDAAAIGACAAILDAVFDAVPSVTSLPVAI